MLKKFRRFISVEYDRKMQNPFRVFYHNKKVFKTYRTTREIIEEFLMENGSGWESLNYHKKKNERYDRGQYYYELKRYNKTPLTTP